MSKIRLKGDYTLEGQVVDYADADATDALGGVLAEAARNLRFAKAGLATYNAVFAHELVSLGIPVFTEEIPTLAVTIGGDGIVRLLVNPPFAAKLSDVDLMFGLVHEVYHIVMAHLAKDEALGTDEVATLAKEIVGNDRSIRVLGRKQVPQEDGKPICICPTAEYARYRRAKVEAAKTDPTATDPVSYEEFVSTDLACAAYLREIPQPKKPKKTICCRASGHPVPGDGDGDGDGSGSNPGNAGVDPEQAGKIVDGILDKAMTRALNGDESAKDALLDLGDTLGDEHPIWGDLGLGALRGLTPPPVEVHYWTRYLQNAITSILTPGANLVYPRKMIAFEDLYEESGYRLPFLPVGDERHTRLLRAIDTSGSMSQRFLDQVAALIGEVPNCEVVDITFDAYVYELEHGDEMRGGGGTSFEPVADYVDQSEEPFDCVLVITDGYAPEMVPAEPDKWVWLITPNGSMWPADKGM